MSYNPTDTYDIAFSVAGEQKSFAKEIKDELEKQGVKCWLYTEKEAEQITDLPPFYEKLFTDRCDHAIPIVSTEYLSKPYTGLERQFIVSRSMKDPRFVIPIQFQEDVKLPGMASTYGYISRNNRSPEQIAQVILEFLNGKMFEKPKEVMANFYIPRLKRTINPITERKAWIKLLIDELSKRSKVVNGLDMDEDDEGQHHKILFQYNGKTLFSIRIIKGGIGSDNGLAFGFDYGSSSGTGMNAWGDFEVTTDGNEVVLNLHSGGFTIPEDKYTKNQLAEALWLILTKHIDEENRR